MTCTTLTRASLGWEVPVADPVDQANDFAAAFTDRAILAARQPVPVGVPGECEHCGDDSLRLVAGRCSPCRDGRKLGTGR